MNDQAASLRRKVESNKHLRQAKTISIISGKGGVGKSNIALNLSLELIRLNKKVIIFDLDVGMGNINILLGLQPKKTIIDLLNENLSINEVIEYGPNNLAFIAGGSGLTEFLDLTEEKQNYFYQQYNELIEMYDYIIFDMGAGVTRESLFFILASDESLVVTTPEPPSITDAYSMIKQIVNHGGKMPLHIILNRARSQKEGLLALQRFQQVIEQFLQIETNALGVIPEDPAVTRAVIEQTPYTLLNEKSQVAKALRKLTENYVGSTEQTKVVEEGTFVQKLIKLLRGRDK